MWSTGSQILYREVTHGKVWTAKPVTVIRDAPDLVALSMLRDTPWKVCAPCDAATDLLHCKADLSPWRLDDAVWGRGDTVFLITPGKAHAVHVLWDAERRFVGWYVNMQEPIRRTCLGFDFLDHELDIVVSPDRDWRWKDRDHLEQAQIIGSLSPEQARAITQEAQQVVDDIARRVVPFDGSWNDWSPPSDRTIPSLPDGWDQVA
jgi:hypothetical protein